MPSVRGAVGESLEGVREGEMSLNVSYSSLGKHVPTPSWSAGREKS